MEKLPNTKKILMKIATKIAYAGNHFSEFGLKRLKNPVFIIGCPRSGTTMLADNIATHADVAAISTEANNLWHPKSYPWQYSDLVKPPFWVDPKKFSEMSLQDWTSNDIKNIKNIFGIYQTLFRKKIFLNKSAMITFYIPFLIKNFPNLRLIHIFRDGRAVALSYAKMELSRMNKNPGPFKKKGYFFDSSTIIDKHSETWKNHILEIEKQKKELKLENKHILYELRYEDYCINPQKWLIEIANFLSIDFQKFKIKNFPQIKSMNFKYKNELGRKDIERISQIMKPALKIKGYELF